MAPLMKPSSVGWAIVFLFVGVVVTRDVGAQEPGATAQEIPRFELTPFVGYRAGQNFDIDASDEEAEVGDHASLALAFGYRGDEFTYEIFYSLQPTEVSSPALSGTSDLDVEYLHFGVSTALSEHFLKPYVLGSVGVARLSLDGEGARDVTEFSLSIAGGVRVPLRDRLELRAEGRGYMTFLSTGSSLFCTSAAAGGGCAVRTEGSTFLQFEALVGVSFRF